MTIMTEEKLKLALKICIESLTWIAENSDVSSKMMSQRSKVTVEEIAKVLEGEDESNSDI